MRFEHYSEPVITGKRWFSRVVLSLILAICLALAVLSIGLMGYHYIGGLSWIDAFLEASMILGGMGAVSPMNGDAIKIFASFYALFSGLFFVTTMGLLLAPWAHRLLHSFYQERRRTNRVIPKKPARP